MGGGGAAAAAAGRSTQRLLGADHGSIVQNQRLAPTAAQKAYNKDLANDRDWTTQFTRDSRSERQNVQTDLEKMRAARAAISSA